MSETSTAMPIIKGTAASLMAIHSLGNLSRPIPPVRRMLTKPRMDRKLYFRFMMRSYRP